MLQGTMFKFVTSVVRYSQKEHSVRVNGKEFIPKIIHQLVYRPVVY